MARIVKPAQRVTIHEARRRFVWADSPGSGFAFTLINGRVSVNNKMAWRNYQLCLRNGFKKAGTWVYGDSSTNYRPRFVLDAKITPLPITDLGIDEWDSVIKEPAELRCDCGETVYLCYIMTNTCPQCGADYNLSGQKLAPRSQWGEETGESVTDIMSYNYSVNTPVTEYEEVDY